MSQNSPLQQPSFFSQPDEPRKSAWSQEFQNFMKETLFESKILDYIDQEFVTSNQNDDVNPNVSSLIAPFIECIKSLGKELSQLLSHFALLAAQSDDTKKLRDLFEATIYEFGLREKERNKLLDSILEKDQQQLQQINRLIKDQRKLQHEINRAQKQHDLKSQRQTGQYKANPSQYTEHQKQTIDESSVYDWIVDIDLMTHIVDKGWMVYLSPKFLKESGPIFEEDATTTEKMPKMKGWEGATIAVTGLYDKGKTFVLNNLTLSNLPSGKKVNTKGISFKHVNVDNGTNLILIDTAGSYSPVKIENEMSIAEKEATEMFILDLVFEVADYFICVVNDFTSLDQRYLDRLSRNLQSSPSKTFREIIVIHNFKELESPDILEHVWANQVTQIYSNGTLQKTKVAALNPQNHALQEKHVLWFKTQFTRHVCLVNEDSLLGMCINPWVFSLLRYWLKAVFVPVNRPFSVVESIMNYAQQKLSLYFRRSLTIQMVSTSDPYVKSIKTDKQMHESIRIPQVSIDSTGLIMARPDSFVPATDVFAGEQYIIYMDVPGMTSEDIDIYRQNVITILKGNRKQPFTEYQKLEKSERKYGEFTLTFKIPDIYERKWTYFGVENGVVTIIYEKDKDDQINSSNVDGNDQ